MPKIANGPTDAQIEEVIDACEAQDKLILNEHMEYMRRIQPIRARKSEIIDIAVNDHGFRRGALRAKLKERGYLQKAIDASGKLEDDDDVAFFDYLNKSIGGLADLPLGKAMMKDAHKSRKARRDSLSELRTSPAGDEAPQPPAGE